MTGTWTRRAGRAYRPAMKTMLLGPTGLRVSELCLGTAMFGNEDWGAGEEDSRRVFEAYYEAGGRFYDCANTYAGGRSEELLGKFAKPLREELVIATKYTAFTRPGDPNSWGNHRKSLRAALDASLRRLDVDYVDVLWVHAWDEVTPFEEIMRALDDAVTAGKVLHVGASNTPAWGVAHANGLAAAAHRTPFCAIQNQYNLAERSSEGDLIPMARHLGLGVLAWAPFAQGALVGGSRPEAGSSARREAGARLAALAAEAGQEPALLALAWLLHRDVIPVIGARTPEQLATLLQAPGLTLEPSLIEALDAIAPPPPVLPQSFMHSEDGVGFFHQGLRQALVTRS